MTGTYCLPDVSTRFNRFVVPSMSERNYFVQPEGLAAVKAFLESPHAEWKSYGIVIGACMTDLSFFFNGRITAEAGQPFRPSYLADSIQAVGGLQIDSELARAWRCGTSRSRANGTLVRGKLSSVEECSDNLRAIRKNMLGDSSPAIACRPSP